VAAAAKPRSFPGFPARIGRCDSIAHGCAKDCPLAGWATGRRPRYRKQPYFVGLRGDRPFGLAGLWERWDKGGEPVESCTILTTEANELMRPIHERMPVIVQPEQYGLWLDPRSQDTEKLVELLRPYPSTGMLAYPVSTLVNNPRNDVPQCVEAIR
jgi:putative SOS response-associated peptidase YedK